MLAIHGRWKLEISNNVLMQCFSDSWNEEAVIAYINEFKETTKPLIGQKWAIISIFDEWELGVPAIEKHVIEHVEWFKLAGCVKDCHVYCPNEVKKKQLDKMIPYSDTGYERRIFTGVNDAVVWLEEEGFIISDKSFLLKK